jgi:hypothetical protein
MEEVSLSVSKVAENRNVALLAYILALGQKKCAKEMSYECLDTRKCCHARLWLLAAFGE